MKKMSEDIITLHLHTTNDDCMMYGSWDMERNKIFCHFAILHYFLSFYEPTPLTTRKIKILKKWKKMPVDIITLHMCTINEYHLMYGS